MLDLAPVPDVDLVVHRDLVTEFRPVLGHCRFQDCHHLTEPACAVRAAVSAGKISSARYESFVKLRAELAELENRY